MKTMFCARTHLAAAALLSAALAAGCASTTDVGSTATAASPLVGTWRLVSFEMELQGTGEKIYPMGKAPSGYLTFQPDGRMAVVLTGEARKPATSEPERAALYSSLVAYTGSYRIESDKWVTRIDAAWNPAWVGSEQPRNFKIAGDTMREESPWFPRADKAMVRVLNTYARVK